MSNGLVRHQNETLDQLRRRAARLLDRQCFAAKARIEDGPGKATRRDFMLFYPECAQLLDQLLCDAETNRPELTGSSLVVEDLLPVELAVVVSARPADDPVNQQARARLDAWANADPIRRQAPTEGELVEWMRANLLLIHLELRTRDRLPQRNSAKARPAK